MKNLRFATLILSSLAACACVLAQDNVIASASTDKLSAYSLPHTEVLRIEASQGRSVEQVLYVSLPRDYHTAESAYPVVFLLDADYAFAITANVVEHFVDRGNLPPVIVVGIGYPEQSQDIPTYRRHRTRDYTPSFTLHGGYGPEIQKLSGGGPAFRDFIAERVIPLIEGRYRTNGERALVGHSFGGLFTTYVLLTKPALFDRYLAVSPSYWYDERFIFELEDEVSRTLEDLPARVALFVGERENPPHVRRAMVDDLETFARQLESRGYDSLTLDTEVFAGETPTASSRWRLRADCAGCSLKNEILTSGPNRRRASSPVIQDARMPCRIRSTRSRAAAGHSANRNVKPSF